MSRVVHTAAKASSSLCRAGSSPRYCEGRHLRLRSRGGDSNLAGFCVSGCGELADGAHRKPRTSPADTPRTFHADERIKPHCLAKLVARPQPRARREAEAREMPAGAVRRMSFRVTKPHEVCLGSIAQAKPASTPTKTHKTKPAMHSAIPRVARDNLFELRFIFPLGGLLWTVSLHFVRPTNLPRSGDWDNLFEFRVCPPSKNLC